MAAYPVVIDDLYEYDLDSFVGEGAFGMVYEGYERKGAKTKVAVKIIRIDKPVPEEGIAGLGKDAQREVLPMDLDHENIINILHYTLKEQIQRILGEKSTKMFLIMELCNMDLSRYCNKLMPSGDEKLNLMHQIAKGMLYLHGKGILHRDLKPGNILVKITNNYVYVRIADYGLARMVSDGEDSILTRSKIGTHSWKAPELFRKVEVYGAPVDIFSLGHVFLALLVCQPDHCDKCRALRMFPSEWCVFL